MNAALARVGAPPRGVSVKYRGQIPPLEQTISGLRVGLLLAVLVIFLLLRPTSNPSAWRWRLC